MSAHHHDLCQVRLPGVPFTCVNVAQSNPSYQVFISLEHLENGGLGKSPLIRKKHLLQLPGGDITSSGVLRFTALHWDHACHGGLDDAFLLPSSCYIAPSVASPFLVMLFATPTVSLFTG